MVDQFQPAEAEHWLASVAAKNAAWFLGKILTAILAIPFIAHVLAHAGITLSAPAIAVYVPALTGMILHVIHDYVKVKTGWSWL